MFAAGTFDPRLMWDAAAEREQAVGVANYPSPAFTGLGERPRFVAEQICLCQYSKFYKKNHIVRYRKRNWCVMRPSNLPAPSLRAVNRLPAVRLSFWVLAFDIKGVRVDRKVADRFFSLLSGRCWIRRPTGTPLSSPRQGLGADGAMQWVRHEQEPLGCRTVALSVPQRQLVRRQQRQYVVLAVPPDRAARTIERHHRRKTDEVDKSGFAHPPVEAAVGNPGGRNGLRRRLDLAQEGLGQIQVPPLLHVERPHDETDPAAGSDHPDCLGDRPAGVAFFEHRDRVDAIEGVVLERQRLGIAVRELDGAGEPIGFRQLCRLAQQEWIYIGGGDRIGGAETPGQQPDQRSGPTADFEDGFAGPRPDRVDQGPEHRLIARHLRPILERGNPTQM